MPYHWQPHVITGNQRPVGGYGCLAPSERRGRVNVGSEGAYFETLLGNTDLSGIRKANNVLDRHSSEQVINDPAHLPSIVRLVMDINPCLSREKGSAQVLPRVVTLLALRDRVQE